MKKIKLKPFNYKKELKKVQGKGIHSKKFKYVTMFSIIGVAILSIFIYRSMAMYSFSSGRYSAFKTTASKKIKINVKANNGYVEGSLVDKILKNNTLKTVTPDFTIGEPPASGNSVGGSGLFSTSDETGTSYYFRGNVNNYVKFAEKTWRIVRINGDGTIRIILDENIGGYTFNNSSNARMYTGYTYNNSTPCTTSSPCQSTYNNSATFSNTYGGTNSNVKTQLETWYYNNLRNYDSKIAYGTYCNDTSFASGSEASTTYYGAYERVANKSSSKYGQPTLICPNPTAGTGYSNTDTTTVNGTRYHTYGGLYKLKIGLLSADEMNYAGFAYSSPYALSSNYLYKGVPWWGLSPYYFSSGNAYVLRGNSGYLYDVTVNNTSSGVRPVINLKADVMATGSGSSGSPYVISEGENITKTTDYKTTATMKVYPNSGYVYDSSKGVTCTNGQNGSYNEANNTLTITSPSKDTECTVNFKRMKLNEWIIANYPKVTNPDFTKGFPPEGESLTDAQIKAGSGLYATQDDSGTSYIFRGQVDNNYVKFGDQEWRILRVNGDGTVRLMLKDKLTNNSKYNYYTWQSSTPEHEKVGYTSGGNSCPINSPCQVTYNKGTKTFTNENGGTNSTIKNALEEWYKTNLNEYDEQIAYGLFCNDISYGSGVDNTSSTSTLYYGAYQRLVSNSTNVTPTLVCPEQVNKNKQSRTYGGLYKSKIGLITADELAMGGLSYNTYASEQNYLRRSYGYWTASPNNSNSHVYVLDASTPGSLSYVSANNDIGAVVPVINLKTDNLTYSGTGEVDNPINIK